MDQRIYDLYNANSFVDTPMLRVAYPQILEAYFAEKTTILDTKEVHFEFIQPTSVKTDIYVVIETINFKGKKIRLSIKEDGEGHYIGADKGVKILVNDGEVDYVEATVGEWDPGEVPNKELFENWAIFKLKLVRKRKGNIQWGSNVQVASGKINNNRLCLIADAHVLNTDFDEEAILYYGTKNPKNNYLNRW